MEKWALITGATAGIGWEFADLMAADGFSLVLVARDESRLNERARDLRHRHKIRCQVVARDLALPGVGRQIFDVVAQEKIEISALLNDAGFGVYGPFSETKLEEELRLMSVNMNAVVELTKLFLEPMLRRKRGRILNVASTASFQPGPSLALYYASKAFVHSFSCALAVELEGTGVTVTSLCPGGTATEFQKRAGMEHSRLFDSRFAQPMKARDVAQIGYHAMRRGQPFVVADWLNKVMVFFSRRAPMMWPAYVAQRLNRER